MGLITCPHCGAGTFDDNKECIFCGGSLVNVKSAAPQKETEERRPKPEPVAGKTSEIQAGRSYETETSDSAAVKDSTLILTDAGPRNVFAIRIIQEATGCSLFEGKHLADSAPSVILKNADFETCARYFNELERNGSGAEVQSGGRTILSTGVQPSGQRLQPQRSGDPVRNTSGKSIVKKVTTTSKDGVVTRTETWEESSTTGDLASQLKDMFRLDRPFI